ncbi:MAG: hypothetical protein RLZZ352_2059 [Pseudomonadota bacterium]|jgi:hypothetical protein
MKPGTPAPRFIHLLCQRQERTRYLHYSLSTAKSHLYWVLFLGARLV